jgi:hypothetical protein
MMTKFTCKPVADVAADNLDPFYKRSTGIAMGFVSTNSGGILST